MSLVWICCCRSSINHRLIIDFIRFYSILFDFIRFYSILFDFIRLQQYSALFGFIRLHAIPHEKPNSKATLAANPIAGTSSPIPLSGSSSDSRVYDATLANSLPTHRWPSCEICARQLEAKRSREMRGPEEPQRLDRVGSYELWVTVFELSALRETPMVPSGSWRVPCWTNLPRLDAFFPKRFQLRDSSERKHRKRALATPDASGKMGPYHLIAGLVSPISNRRSAKICCDLRYRDPKRQVGEDFGCVTVRSY